MGNLDNIDGGPARIKKRKWNFGTQMQKGKGGIQKGHFYSFKVF